jgi:hypothetical protein
MNEYNCVPSTITVSPCPAGTAPVITVTTEGADFDRYPNVFDHLAIQDILILILFLFSLFSGFNAGKK